MRAARAALAVAALGLAAAGASAATTEPALMIREGGYAKRQVVGLGRDVVVAGEALADVAALDGSVRVTGRVGGDVIVVGGDAHLGPEAQVEGDVFVLGGLLDAAEGARIGGRSVAYPTVSSAWVVLLEGPSLGHPAFSGVVVSAKLALLTGWLVWSVLLLSTSGRGVLATAEGVIEQPFRSFFVGLTGVLAAFLTAAFFSAFAAVVVGLPLLFLVVLVALLLKLWGMVAVFYALGAQLVRRLLRRRASPLNAALAGLVLLGAVKMLPWAGAWVWTMATLIGVGATLTTNFGRREAWLEPSRGIA
ncbi:MAG: hypothetical protein R3325_08605 [Thermoanaerobaculia bacterium]|nr:hypothetical protein [Thermoanaerobaculia bacterium]